MTPVLVPRIICVAALAGLPLVHLALVDPGDVIVAAPLAALLRCHLRAFLGLFFFLQRLAPVGAAPLPVPACRLVEIPEPERVRRAPRTFRGGHLAAPIERVPHVDDRVRQGTRL